MYVHPLDSGFSSRSSHPRPVCFQPFSISLPPAQAYRAHTPKSNSAITQQDGQEAKQQARTEGAAREENAAVASPASKQAPPAKESPVAQDTKKGGKKGGKK
ncbi:hypothetical protein FI667_g15596, partial [Globisporangium splendens]